MRRPTRPIGELSPGEAALLTDLYQLTMARGHWHAGRLDAEGTFLLSFRRAPFGGTFAVAAGIARAVQLLETLRFDDAAIASLAVLPGPGGERPLFEPAFLDLLASKPLRLDVDAVPDGTVVLPHVPLVRVTGPLWQAQLVETLLLNVIGFETLIATKAARIVHATGGDPVLEFGARRAQGPGATVAAARAAWIGGAAGTSNVLAAAQLGIPVKGTHAHSWVQSFAGDGDTHASERAAFEAFTASMPDGCVLLVDTYDTDAGIENAIEVARTMRERGHELAGIRLDSGDLGLLARLGRERLDAAGFTGVKIVASDDLDEHKIRALRAADAPIDVWGVGTRLVTGGDQAALGVVYKLSAVRESAAEPWRGVMKLSSEPAKRSLPGRVEVARVRAHGALVGDVLHLGDVECARPLEGVATPLLVPALEAGVRAPGFPVDLQAARERARAELAALPASARRLEDPEPLEVFLADRLMAERDDLVTRHLGEVLA